MTGRGAHRSGLHGQRRLHGSQGSRVSGRSPSTGEDALISEGGAGVLGKHVDVENAQVDGGRRVVEESNRERNSCCGH